VPVDVLCLVDYPASSIIRVVGYDPRTPRSVGVFITYADMPEYIGGTGTDNFLHVDVGKLLVFWMDSSFLPVFGVPAGCVFVQVSSSFGCFFSH